MNATGDNVRTSGAAGDIGNATGGGDGQRIGVAAWDIRRIATEVDVADALNGGRLELSRRDKELLVKASAACACMADIRFQGHRIGRTKVYRAVGTTIVDACLIYETGQQGVGTEQRVVAVEVEVEIDRAVAGSPDFRVERANTRSKVGV